MNLQNSQNKAKIITTITGAIIACFVFFGACSRSYEIPLAGGVEINFGYDEEGMGDNTENDQPVIEEALEQQAEPIEEQVEQMPEPVEEQQEEAQEEQQEVQDKPNLVDEQSKIDIIKAKKEAKKKADAKKDAKEKADKKAKEIADKKAKEKADKERRDRANALLKKFKKGASGGDGDGNKAGNQGKEIGDKNSKNYNNLGGNGVNEYYLNGRKALSKPKIKPKNCSEAGIVVVEIKVNKTGKVIDARAVLKSKFGGRTYKSTNMAQCLVLAAQKSAKSTTWEPSGLGNTLQQGVITYQYNLKK